MLYRFAADKFFNQHRVLVLIIFMKIKHTEL